MLSSNRVIKANRASSGLNKATIATEYELPQKEVKQGNNSKIIGERTVMLEKADELLKEAETASQQLIEETKAEITKMRKKAIEKAHQEGYEAGLKKGYNEGYEKGSSQATLENQAIRERAVKMLQESHEAIHQYKQEKKEDLLKLATHMAEKIVHDYIDYNSDGLLAIAKPFFYQLDKEEEFVTISVHPEKREKIKEKLDEIKAISPGTRFMILGDPSLEKCGILIESSHAVIDLQIRKQLDRMLEEIHEMERTVDA